MKRLTSTLFQKTYSVLKNSDQRVRPSRLATSAETEPVARDVFKVGEFSLRNLTDQRMGRLQATLL